MIANSFRGWRGRPKRERPIAWGTIGLPWESAWVWDIEALGCVGRGLRRAAWGAAGGLCLSLERGTLRAKSQNEPHLPETGEKRLE